MRPLPCLCSQYASIPHPARPPASSPAPRGGGSRGDTQGKAVSGRVDPCAGSLFSPSPYTGPWEVSPRGVGQTGRGQKPPPLSLLSICWLLSPQAEGHQRSQRTTPRGSLISICQHPPPRGGPGAVVAIPGERPYPGRIPMHWTVGGIPTGGGADGEGAKSPLPCLWVQYASIPHPARPPASSPTPGRAGGSRGDTRGKAVPGAYPQTLDRGRHPHGGEGQTGRGQKAPSPVSAFNVTTKGMRVAGFEPANSYENRS